MINIATIVTTERQGTIHHMIYELAAYDLNVFLTTPRRSLRSKRKETVSPSRTNSEHMWPADLMLESRNLADALDYLHNRLYDTSSVSLAHNDIKPENVLVFYPDSTDAEIKYPVGKWKFADFGLSRIKDKKKRDTYLTADRAMPAPPKIDFTHRHDRRKSVSKTTPKRDPGRYTAPELDQYIVTKTDGREADIWSFGCMLSEIVAWAVNLDHGEVRSFRRELSRGSNDTRFYDVNTKEVKEAFLDYLETLKKHKGHRMCKDPKWVESSVDLVREIVVTDPGKRLRAEKIRDRLREIDHSMRYDLKLQIDTAASILEDAPEPGPANSSTTESPTEYSGQKNNQPRFDFSESSQGPKTPAITVSAHSA
ncbi:kinase-like protein [Lentithecium fluviatile CBS 122367]|uniref:Kinase-like protein n=1 Tax=Lentithecium fluviatile CBS 122367 TaxID=1168545 RepID=A0A6G1IE33_9PLEO|nr:kinase-like protein [Lentithecium fluviatile CBS 122367]